MSAATELPGLTATALQVVAVVAGAPFIVGGMRQVRARLEGRAGRNAQDERGAGERSKKHSVFPQLS